MYWRGSKSRIAQPLAAALLADTDRRGRLYEPWAHVYVSEFSAPPTAAVIWRLERPIKTSATRKRKTELLVRVDP